MFRLNFGQHKQNIYTSQVHKLLIQLGLKYTLMQSCLGQALLQGRPASCCSLLLQLSHPLLEPSAVMVTITNHMVHKAPY